MTNESSLYDEKLIFPDPEAARKLSALVGIDNAKDVLSKAIGVTVNPTGIRRWVQQFHPRSERLVDAILQRPRLFILAGDVGTGKTTLAETIGDKVARDENIRVTLYKLSLVTRGRGLVGEMTTLLTAAFAEITEQATKIARNGEAAKAAFLMLIDEADALAQSRETNQMHHEDRAGVNALIRGIDMLSRDRLPVAVLMCTNRLGAIDPAVKRRAGEIFEFCRPNDEQRFSLLRSLLDGVGFSDTDLNRLVKATGPLNGRAGFTYSDIVQRLMPAIVLNAYPNKAITALEAVRVTRDLIPTPPFQEAVDQ